MNIRKSVICALAIFLPLQAQLASAEGTSGARLTFNTSPASFSAINSLHHNSSTPVTLSCAVNGTVDPAATYTITGVGSVVTMSPMAAPDANGNNYTMNAVGPVGKATNVSVTAHCSGGNTTTVRMFKIIS